MEQKSLLGAVKRRERQARPVVPAIMEINKTRKWIEIAMSGMGISAAIVASRLQRSEQGKGSNNNESTQRCGNRVQNATLYLRRIEGEHEKSFDDILKEVKGKIDPEKEGVEVCRFERDSLHQLTPVLDDEGIIRLASRVSHATWFAFDTRYPAILPKDAPLSRLIVRHFHERFYHQNQNAIIAAIRTRFWVYCSDRLLPTASGAKTLLQDQTNLITLEYQKNAGTLIRMRGSEAGKIIMARMGLMLLAVLIRKHVHILTKNLQEQNIGSRRFLGGPGCRRTPLKMTTYTE